MTSARASLAAATLALALSGVMFFSTFYGEDEALTLGVVERVAKALLAGDLFQVAAALGKDWHPPGRNLVAVPFVWLFGPELWAIRLPNVLAWAAICVLAALIAARRFGAPAQWLVGIGLAATGAFQIEAMAFGHGMATLVGLLLILRFLDAPPAALLGLRPMRDFRIAAAIAAVGFLWFTTFIVICGMLHVAYLVAALRVRPDQRSAALRAWFVASLPFGLFYVAYYAIFLGVPYLLWQRGIVDAPFGQLFQYTVRVGQSHLNVAAALENFRVVNYYMFPFVYFAAVLVGLLHVLRHERSLALLLVPYGLITCFYMSGNTGQHFLSFAIWMLAFGGGALAGPVARAIPRIALGAAAATVAAWTAFFHAWPYGDARYPAWGPNISFGDQKWPNNAILPVAQIQAELRVAASDRPVASLVGGAWELRYMPALAWAQDVKPLYGQDGCLAGVVDGSGNKVALVLASEQPAPCAGAVVRSVAFDDSRVRLFLFQE